MRNKPRRLRRADVVQSAGNFFAFGFGAGLSKFAPGTCGTLIAIPLFLWLLAPYSAWVQFGIIIAAFLLGIRWCARAAKSVAAHDHPGIVWDEIVGLWMAYFLVPLSAYTLLFGFAVFRLLDIVKPWPIRQIDRRVGGGLGIMLDDAIAGIATNLLLHLAVNLPPLASILL